LIAMMSSPPSGAAAKGYRGGYVLKADDGDDIVVAVMYDDKDAHVAMVHDPQGTRTSARSWSCSRASRCGPTASGSDPRPEAPALPTSRTPLSSAR
jgi:hypothetical protein